MVKKNVGTHGKVLSLGILSHVKYQSSSTLCSKVNSYKLLFQTELQNDRQDKNKMLSSSISGAWKEIIYFVINCFFLLGGLSLIRFKPHLNLFIDISSYTLLWNLDRAMQFTIVPSHHWFLGRWCDGAMSMMRWFDSSMAMLPWHCWTFSMITLLIKRNSLMK